MEPFNNERKPEFSSAKWLNDAVSGAYQRAQNDGAELVAKGEHFIEEHKAVLAAAVGATAAVAAFTIKGKFGSAAEKLLTEAEKVIGESHIGYDVAKFEPLTKTALVEYMSPKSVELARKAASSNMAERYMAAASWDASPELLHGLSQDPARQVRMMVAKNPLTPRDTLQNMMQTDIEEVRDAAEFGLERRVPMQLAFAKDPRASIETLHRLATEDLQAVKVREAVALHRETAPHTLEHLAKDPEPEIRVLAAMHSRTPIHTLDLLSLDSNPTVREFAAANKFVPDRSIARLAFDRDPRPRFEVAWHWYTKPETLDYLSKDLFAGVRGGVALNAQTDASVLSRLSYDKDPTVRYMVAGNPNLDDEALKRLSDDEEGMVRLAAKHVMRKKAAN